MLLENSRAIECTLLIWVLQVKIKTVSLTVVKWAVLMDYDFFTFFCCSDPK